MATFKRNWYLIVLGVMSVIGVALAQQNYSPGNGQTVLTTAAQFQLWTPAQLGVSGLTEPAAGTSALSTIVDMRGVRSATLTGVCTTGNYTVNVTNYAEDGSTVVVSALQEVTAITANTNYSVHFGSESTTLSSTGTLAASNATLTLPQRAIAFSFTNAGGAGTCTARLYLQY